MGQGVDLGRGAGAGAELAVDAQPLQLVAASHRRLGLADAAVGHKEDVVLAAHRGGGEDQAVGLVDARLARGLHLDLGANRGGGFAYGHQANLLDFIDAGLGRLGLGHGDGGGRGRGGNHNAIDRLARQRAHELNAVALVAAAGHAHIGAAADHAQAAQSGPQGGNELALGHEGADLDVLGACAVAEAQTARESCGHGQLELGVGLGVKSLLGRQADALVDVDQQVFHLGGQAVYAFDFGAGGGGLQAGEVAARMTGVGDEGQTKVHLAQRQADGVVLAGAHAGECIHIAGTDGDQVGLLDDRAVGQHHFLAALLDRKIALDAEKAKQVDLQAGGGLDDLALTAGHGQRQGAAGAGGNVQRRLAPERLVIGVLPAVVHHLVASLASLVDEDTDAGGRGGQALDALKRQAAGGGLEAGPGAAGVVAGSQQGQAEFGLIELQAYGIVAAAPHAHEGADARAANQQRVCGHRFAAKEGDAAAGRFKGQLTRQADKAKQVQLHIAGGAGELTQAAVTVEHHGLAVAAGHDFELHAAVVDHQILGRASTGDAAVDFDQ